jgi:hypothetical protein
MRFAFALKLTVLGLTASLLGCGSPDEGAPSSTVEQPVVADAVYFNGRIITVDDDNPKATAVAIKDGKIIYVGDVRGAADCGIDPANRFAGKNYGARLR